MQSGNPISTNSALVFYCLTDIFPCKMAPLLAPYNSAMRLGSGFNSYTHELCLDDAVKKGTGSPPKLPDGEGVAQSVVFKTSVIDKMSDITDALNVCLAECPSGYLYVKKDRSAEPSLSNTTILSMEPARDPLSTPIRSETPRSIF